jgi:predicted DNA-binding transcriptional regulator AlpA
LIIIGILDINALCLEVGEMKISVQIDGEDVLDIKDVSEITGLNLNKIYELLRYDRFPKPIVVKNKNFWKKAEIEAYMESTRNPRE